MRPPLAITACAPQMTLFTRAMMANTAESLMTVVWIPASAYTFAVSCPTNVGAVSTTMTSNLRRFAAAFKNSSTVDDLPKVRMTSFAWMCSSACSWMGTPMFSNSSIASVIPSITTPRIGAKGASRSTVDSLSRMVWSAFPASPVRRLAFAVKASSRIVYSTRRTIFPTTNSSGCAAINSLPIWRTRSRHSPTDPILQVPTMLRRMVPVCSATAI
mmetsp:Transcript_81655/g.197921  ORF Transcript_81655/g.197921 Transcript_81655/m.197921 type:complete len:215 (-) Transcript_81655:201-845(-)